ncbi:MAG: hypothetical protein HDT00_00285 [Bacteroidales bacterium]|nr:hypothetical protein [Bacteroidales bacterium]
MKRTYKNPISSAMSEYREDFRYNREWWAERMGTGNNNEYLLIMYKNGDCVVVQSDYFQLDGHTCLPRFRADEVAYISRYYGDQCETTTAADIVVDTDRIKLYADGVEVFRYEMSETEYKEMHRQMMELADDIDFAAWMLDYCRQLATSKINNNPTPKTSDTMNTETKTMDEIAIIEFSELSHAGQCVDLYLRNTAEIYHGFTQPAIARVVNAYKAGEHINNNPEQLAKDIQEITPAINAAVRLVKKFDHMTPTAKDIEQVMRNYVACIIDNAKYEVENA